MVRTWVPECPHCRQGLLSADERAETPKLRPDGTFACVSCGESVAWATYEVRWLRVAGAPAAPGAAEAPSRRSQAR